MQDGERPGRYEDDEDDDDEGEGGGTATGVLACATIIIALLMLSKIIALKRQVPLLLVDVSVAIFSFLFDYVCGKDERRTTGGKRWVKRGGTKGLGPSIWLGLGNPPPSWESFGPTLFEGYSRHVYFTFTRRLRERK